MRRTWLFTPGNRPDRFDKAASSGADQIILDLEDSVEPSAKDEARRSVVEWLSHGGAAWVRINAKDSDYYEADVRMLAELPGLLGFMVPKAEVPAALEELGRRLPPRGLIPLIETAVGVHRAAEIGACEGVDRLAFGSIDFALDIEAAETSQSLLFARSQLVIASRVNGLPAPVDGVTTELRDTAAASSVSIRPSSRALLPPSPRPPTRCAGRPRSSPSSKAMRGWSMTGWSTGLSRCVRAGSWPSMSAG
jgi:citrate lyase subunit beta/citryl-CoA lyase